MPTIIRYAESSDIEPILALVNRFAAHNIMLPRTAESVRRSLGDWLVAVDDGRTGRRRLSVAARWWR